MKPVCNERSPHGWTLDTLEEHLSYKIKESDVRTTERFALSREAVTAALNASEKAINAAMAAAEKAVSKAEMAAEKRFDGVNEFRSAMKDQQSTFADRTQTDFRLNSIEAKLEKIGGKSEGVSMMTYIIVQIVLTLAGIGSIIAVFRH